MNISCPVLITHGEYDKTGKVRYYCKIWHEQTNYPLQIIKGAGHNANVDNPEEMGIYSDEELASYYESMSMNAIYALQSYLGIWE